MGFPSSHNFTKRLVTKKNADDLSNRGNHWFPALRKGREKGGSRWTQRMWTVTQTKPRWCAAAGGPPRLHNSFLNLLLHFPLLSQFILPFNSLFNWRNKISCYLFIIEQVELEHTQKDILCTSIEVWPIMHCSNFPWYPGILKISKPSKMCFSSSNHWRNWNTSSKIYWLRFFLTLFVVRALSCFEFIHLFLFDLSSLLHYSPPTLSTNYPCVLFLCLLCVFVMHEVFVCIYF